MNGSTDEHDGGRLVRDAAVLILTGVLLGVGSNWLARSQGPTRGLAWIGEDRLAQLASSEMVTAVPDGTPAGPAAPISDDPLAVPPSDDPLAIPPSDDPLAIPGGINAAAPTLPQIPSVGRPVQIETGAVAQLVAAGAAYLIDAREPYEYAEGHIPGSVNLPYDLAITDPVALESLDTGGLPIIVYCGGGTCEISLSLAHELIALGHERVAVYMGGYPEWRDLGHEVVAGGGA